MENHLFVGFERFAQLFGFVRFEGGLAGAVEILFHLSVVELLSRHIEVPVGLWEHARDQEHSLVSGIKEGQDGVLV